MHTTVAIRLEVSPSCETCRRQRCRSCQSQARRTCRGRGIFRDGCVKWSSNSPCRHQPHFEHSSAQQSRASCASKPRSGRRSQTAPAPEIHSRSWSPRSTTDGQTADDWDFSVQTFRANLSASNSWRSCTRRAIKYADNTDGFSCCCYYHNVNNKNGGQPACLHDHVLSHNLARSQTDRHQTIPWTDPVQHTRVKQRNYSAAGYDTIRYDIDLRALKSWRDGQLNLAHGPETKNNEKNKNQKPSSSEESSSKDAASYLVWTPL